MKRFAPWFLAAAMVAVAILAVSMMGGGDPAFAQASSGSVSSSSSGSVSSSASSSASSSSSSSSSSSGTPYAIISWNAPTTDANGNPLTSAPTYQIFWSTVAGQAVIAFAAESPPGVQCCTYTAGPLVPGTQYWWYVTASNSIGTSVPSALTSQLVPGSSSSNSSSSSSSSAPSGPAAPAAPTGVSSQIVWHTVSASSSSSSP